jgi:hypothetical protein
MIILWLNERLKRKAMLLLMLKAKKALEKKEKLYSMLLLFYLRESIRTRHYVALNCLHHPVDSPWVALYKNGIDFNFINTTSLNR